MRTHNKTLRRNSYKIGKRKFLQEKEEDKNWKKEADASLEEYQKERRKKDSL